MSNTETIICNICFTKYDNTDRQPITLSPCDHTFCLQCVNKLKSQSNQCHICNRIVIKETLNNSILESMKQADSDQYKAPNHPHPFLKCIIENDWRCDGQDIYGKCKSVSGNHSTRYKCQTCQSFFLCHECLIEPKIFEFHTPNHPHSFFIYYRDNGWSCDGGKIFGNCKSDLNQFNKSYGFTRYKCKTCSNYDLCERCLNG